ncbi:hypothetical protein ACVWY0_003948 [Arthrobacter sp. UYNi723]
MLRPPSYTDTFDVPADALVTVRLDFAGVDWASILAGNPALNLSKESHLLTTGSFGSVALVAEQDAQTDDEALTTAEEEDETEAVDKTTLKLPGRQDELVHRVAAAAEHTIVVVNAATPVLMPWLADVDAVLIAGLPGQEAGEAVAAVLTGEAEPTGRLVTSYPISDDASPAWNVTPDRNLAVHYSEGTAIGYRGYRQGLAPAPLFWFGHGLGYGSWEYGAVRPVHGAAPTLEVEITNTSARPSRETVQVYFNPADESQPVRLAGYSGIDVPAGETATVTVTCDPRLFRRWDENANAWSPLTGGELLVARGLGDIRARLRMN